ncbi:glycosyltransferase family 1 protein [Halobacillus sp. BBL2006]|uniref:glycosyltransferase family 4 protein n=1 Tax=Halobacillus sp. BBL2006 TaxID=1543706 RepID=UPI0005423EFB|nr:glycosyltransferase family 1 protein [Halobacillus sp. BBL2006]KHE73050.1 glycosyl transferase [Halobacillus sp. BBL2006]
MKITIFTDTYDPQVNGVSKTLKRYVNYLKESGVEYQLFAPETGEETFDDNTIHRFNSLPLYTYPECRLALPNLFTIRKKLEQFQPHLIHIATPFNIGLSGLFLGKKLDIPLVGSYHTHFDRYLQYYNLPFLSKWTWGYLRWFHQYFQTTFVPSEDTKSQLLNHGFTDLKIWSRGVDCEAFRPGFQAEWVKQRFSIKERHILTYVGRLAPEKNLEVLMDVSKQLPTSISDQAHWLIVGDGPLKEALQKAAPSNMTFTGYQEGRMLTQIYASSSLFIFPSTTETFGNVALESLACGTPVIASRSGGLQEIIQNEKTGILCTPGSAEEFSYSIAELLNDQKRLEKMSTAARTYATTRSWDTVFSQLLSDCEEVLVRRVDPYPKSNQGA